jgi:hypothetical protein
MCFKINLSYDSFASKSTSPLSFFFILQDIVVNIFVGAKKDFEEGFAHMFNKNNHFIHRNLKRSLFLYRDYLDFEFLN